MPGQIPPETADGWMVLHQLFRADWAGFHRLGRAERRDITAGAAEFLQEVEAPAPDGQTACFHVFGHKADLMLVHFRETLDQCLEAELALAQQPASEVLKPTGSYLSIVELGLYYDTIAIRDQLQSQGLAPDSAEWAAEFDRQIAARREQLRGRRFPEIPSRKYVSFYPMNKRRGETHNWYELDVKDRARLMMGHGEIGRKFAGEVQQIISGSVGLDDWEWAVDLFADDPLAIKRLVYEMRFDEGSAVYGEFGPFYFGRRVPAAYFGEYLAGSVPAGEEEEQEGTEGTE